MRNRAVSQARRNVAFRPWLDQPCPACQATVIKMKTRFQKLVRFLCLLCLALWAAAPRTSAQSPPGLGLNLYPGVSIAGVVGTVCAIQATANAAQTNGWTCLALVQLPATNYLWVDTSATVATGQRFYRAVVTATNLASILPGAFTMGSPRSEALRGSDETQHVVTISRGFWMGEYLVTQADYQAVAGAIRVRFRVRRLSRSRRSVGMMRPTIARCGRSRSGQRG